MRAVAPEAIFGKLSRDASVTVARVARRRLHVVSDFTTTVTQGSDVLAHLGHGEVRVILAAVRHRELLVSPDPAHRQLVVLRERRTEGDVGVILHLRPRADTRVLSFDAD